MIISLLHLHNMCLDLWISSLKSIITIMIESDNDDCTPNKIIVCITSILLYCVLLHKCMCMGYILLQLNRISLGWPSIFGSSNIFIYIVQLKKDCWLLHSRTHVLHAYWGLYIHNLQWWSILLWSVQVSLMRKVCLLLTHLLFLSKLIIIIIIIQIKYCNNI